MFHEHQPAIADYAFQSPEHLFSVFKFVQATINRRFEMVPRVMADDSFTAHQQRAIDQAWAWRHGLYTVCQQYEPVKLWYQLQSMHNIGQAKAGFLVQLLRGTLGCLDRHWLTHFMLPARYFRERCRQHQYLLLCQQIGSATLWDTWCNLIAESNPHAFPSADAVSAWHLYCIVGDQHEA